MEQLISSHPNDPSPPTHEEHGDSPRSFSLRAPGEPVYLFFCRPSQVAQELDDWRVAGVDGDNTDGLTVLLEDMVTVTLTDEFGEYYRRVRVRRFRERPMTAEERERWLRRMGPEEPHRHALPSPAEPARKCA